MPSEVGSEHPRVTVVIPVYNEVDHLAMCLDALIAQDYPISRIEILVVDGVSDDGSRELVGEYAKRSPAPEIRLLDNPDRIPATALNKAGSSSRSLYFNTSSRRSLFRRKFAYLTSNLCRALGIRDSYPREKGKRNPPSEPALYSASAHPGYTSALSGYVSNMRLATSADTSYRP